MIYLVQSQVPFAVLITYQDSWNKLSLMDSSFQTAGGQTHHSHFPVLYPVVSSMVYGSMVCELKGSIQCLVYEWICDSVTSSPFRPSIIFSLAIANRHASVSSQRTFLRIVCLRWKGKIAIFFLSEENFESADDGLLALDRWKTTCHWEGAGDTEFGCGKDWQWTIEASLHYFFPRGNLVISCLWV